ncbi:MAG: DUF4234 domain-containing protein [Ruminococcaceae bacterium]|nr:DUF4234 domain-containing protein [Oscillospiraceae bacterium]
MKIEKRNIGVAILLSFVTCGIYGIIWAIKMLKEAVQVRDEYDSGTTEIILGILLPGVGFYMAEKKFNEGCQMRGIPHEDHSTLYIILGFLGLGIVDYAMMQSDLNSVADILFPEGPAPAYAPQPQYQQPQYQPPQQPQYQEPQYQEPQYQAPQEAPYTDVNNTPNE